MIFVDPRYGTAKAGRTSAQKAVALALAGFPGIVVEESVLPFGDFTFLGHGPDDAVLQVGIELKTVSDFVTSMQTGRLAGYQVPGLLETYQRAYIVVQGFYRANRRTGALEMPAGNRWRALQVGQRPVFWSDVEKFISSLEELGIRVRRTRTPNETASVIGQVLYPFWQKPYDEHATFHAHYTAPATLALVREDEAAARIRRVCVALKTGIGYGRSKAVADRFESVYGMVTAEPAAWQGLPGIGKGIVAQTVQALHERVKVQAVRAGRVPARHEAATGDARATQRRSQHELDAGRRAQRGVPAARPSRRVARRGKPQ